MIYIPNLPFFRSLQNGQPNGRAVNKMPIMQPISSMMNNYNGYDQANNADKGRGAISGGYTGPMISVNHAAPNQNMPPSIPLNNNDFR